MSKIFVGNLNFAVSEAALELFIRECGVQAERVSIVRDNVTGRSRGFGFVELTNSQDLDDAIGILNGKNLEGRPLNVNLAHERSGSRRP